MKNSKSKDFEEAQKTIHSVEVTKCRRVRSAQRLGKNVILEVIFSPSNSVVLNHEYVFIW